MLEIKTIPLGPFQTNCYVVCDPEEQSCIIIDPAGDAEQLLNTVADLDVNQIILTHGHPDHVGALEEVRSALGVPVGIHPADAEHFSLNHDFDLTPGMELALAGGKRWTIFRVEDTDDDPAIFDQQAQ